MTLVLAHTEINTRGLWHISLATRTDGSMGGMRYIIAHKIQDAKCAGKYAMQQDRPLRQHCASQAL